VRSAPGGDEDVGWLAVAMRDAFLVRCPEPIGNLNRDIQ
jgi:hypothetical protein